MQKKKRLVSRKPKTIDVNGPVASRFVNKFVDLALRDIVLSRKEMRAHNGKMEVKVSYPLARYLRQGKPFRKVEFSLTARIK